MANVVFLTAVVQGDDRLLIYYGASDEHSAVVEIVRTEVLAALE